LHAYLARGSASAATARASELVVVFLQRLEGLVSGPTTGWSGL